MRPTRKNTLGQTPKLSYAPCDKPLSSQASLRVLFPESILGVFLLFVVVVMYKRIGMSNESILHTTSAALLPLLLKPFAVSMRPASAYQPHSNPSWLLPGLCLPAHNGPRHQKRRFKYPIFLAFFIGNFLLFHQQHETPLRLQRPSYRN